MPRSTTSHDDDFAQYVERIVAEMPAKVPVDPDGARPLNAPGTAPRRLSPPSAPSQRPSS